MALSRPIRPLLEYSQRRLRARSTSNWLESASDGAGMAAYLLGLAAAANATAADLSTGRRSSHREVCA